MSEPPAASIPGHGEPPPHTFHAELRWAGSTAVGYERYDRTHEVAAPPAEAPLRVTADPAFGGDERLLDPEQLLVMATASCQLLSFLAVAARARIDVVSYTDEAVGFMPRRTKHMWITEIRLQPRIEVRGGRPGASNAAAVDENRVRHLVAVAHRECFIANSLRTEITIEPHITIT
jgi:organic hydroperoxide reductase OsmC/OhrA